MIVLAHSATVSARTDVSAGGSGRWQARQRVKAAIHQLASELAVPALSGRKSSAA